MKKLILSMGTLSLVVISCEKDNYTAINQNSSQKSSIHEQVISSYSMDQTQTRSNTHRYFYDLETGDVEGIDYGCWDGDGNCLLMVVVWGVAAGIINDLGDAWDAEDYEGVISLVNENMEDLSRIVDQELLEDVVNEHVYLKVRGRATSTSNAYMVFSDGEDIILVQPVGLDS